MDPSMTDTKEQFADVSAKRLARIYAEALLNAAEAANVVAPVLDEIDSLIDDVLRQDTRLNALLAGAAVGRRSRKEAIEKAFANRASDTVYKFLLVLNDHDRLDLLAPVRTTLHELHDERARRVRVHVYSATPLSDEFQERIRETLRSQFKLEPSLELQVDAMLLGGMKIRIGDKVYDATVRTKIDNLRNQLIARSSHEIQSGRDRFSSAV
jgi:F-type H+-transporting ATPase subunit delta